MPSRLTKNDLLVNGGVHLHVAVAVAVAVKVHDHDDEQRRRQAGPQRGP
jgi:hypothetical protein